MNRWILWMLLVVGLAAGCTKREPDPGALGVTQEQLDTSTVPPSPPGIGAGADSPTNTNPAVIADTGDVNAALQQLTLELRDHVVRTRSVPKSFEEFAAKSQVRYPPAPDGKKYAIQGQAVVLVNR